MKTIWKYPLETINEQGILVPKGAEVLTIQIQNEKPCLWVLCDGSLAREKLIIQTYGTGHDVPEKITNRHYIGTYQLENGALIFHVFIKA